VVPPPLNRYLRTIRSFHPTFTTFNPIQPLGRHIRRPRSDLDLICPSSRHNPKWDWLPTTFTHLTALEDVFQSSFIHKLCPVFYTQTVSCPLSYLYATCKSYTQISLLHDKRDYWHFQGVYKLPHLYLTWIQQLLLTIASITPSTRTLLLVAMVNAPHRRFGGSPLYITSVALCDTVAIHKYPCFVALTYSTFLSTLVSRIYTEFLLFG